MPDSAPLTYLSLFSGIGGLDLGLDRAGLLCVGQVEINPFCRQVLAKHWPEVPRHDDVRTAVEWWGSRPSPGVVAGGFPCQPVSESGKGLAQDDERWLWPEFADILSQLRPRFALMENVPGLLTRGMGDVLGDLAGLGYDAEWSIVSACALGASHPRERVLIVAHDDRDDGFSPWQVPPQAAPAGLPLYAGQPPGSGRGSTTWATEPAVGRVADGVPDRVDRLVALGNSVVPAVGEYAGRLLTGLAQRIPLREAAV